MDLVKLKTFEDKLPFLTYKGVLCTPAKTFGAVLEYGDDGGKLTKMISQEWSEEFKPGHHFEMLKGKNLKDFKALSGLGTESVPSSAHHLMLLLEPGINRVLLLTKKPIGIKVRDFLDTEVMPQLAKTGEYTPKKAIKATGKGPSLSTLSTALRELRLASVEMRRNGWSNAETRPIFKERMMAVVLQFPATKLSQVPDTPVPQQMELPPAPPAAPALPAPSAVPEVAAPKDQFDADANADMDLLFAERFAKVPFFLPPGKPWNKDTYYNIYMVSEQWKARRTLVLHAHPNCIECAKHGTVSKATTVHHTDLAYKELRTTGVENLEHLEPVCAVCNQTLKHAEHYPTIFDSAQKELPFKK